MEISKKIKKNMDRGFATEQFYTHTQTHKIVS